MKNETLAFCVAPLAVPLAFLLIISGFEIQYGVLDYLSNLLLIAFFSLPVAYVVELVVGLPMYLLLKRIGLINFITLFLGGIVISCFPLLLLWFAGVYDGEEHKLAATLPVFAFIGAATGFTFWLTLNFHHIIRR